MLAWPDAKPGVGQWADDESAEVVGRGVNGVVLVFGELVSHSMRIG